MGFNNKRNNKVAIIGHRGIPNSYGGFETLAEEISWRLAKSELKPIVYCRSNYFSKKPNKYKGADLIYLPTISNKILDTPFHTALSVLHILFFNKAKTVLAVNVGNAPFLFLLKIFGKRIIFNVDGLDWERKKWGKFAAAYLKFCSYLAPYAAHKIITDSVSVRNFYKSERRADSVLVPYGTDISESFDKKYLDQVGVEYKKYFLYVSRFEPEYNPLLVVKAYKKSGSNLPLVMIGDNKYNKNFVEKIKKEARGGNIIFLGYVFGKKYKSLLSGALAYIRSAEVGGLSPAVIEAMGRGVSVIANDKAENREMLGDFGVYFDLKQKALSRHIKFISENTKDAIKRGKALKTKAEKIYSWDGIANSYYQIISELNPECLRNKKRIFITGAGGMLGRAMYNHFSKDYAVKATDIDFNENWLSFLDVRDKKAYEKAVKSFRPDYIFHLAAMTSLEECEEDVFNSYATNSLSVKYAADLSAKYGAKLVYISSAGVYDGEKKFYIDSDEPNPINVYGVTKYFGEIMTKKFAKDYLILRPGWMMGGGPGKDKKFISHIVNQLLSGQKEIYAVTDKLGTPSYTHDIAKNLELLIRTNSQGTYNTVCSGFASRYEVAKEIIKILGYTGEVNLEAVNSDYFGESFYAKRPFSENLVNKRLKEENKNLMRPWKSALREYLKNDYSHAFAEVKENVLLKYKPIN